MTDVESAQRWLAAYERVRSDTPPLHGQPAALAAAADTTIAAIPNAGSASITRLDRDGWTTLAGCGPLAAPMDAFRRSLGDGTYLGEPVGRGVLHSGDVVQDDRWPSYGPATAADVEVHSLLTVPVVSCPHRKLVALNVYSSIRYAFTDQDILTAMLVAADIAGALTALAHRELAADAYAGVLTSWDIGVATGRLVHQLDVTAEQAYTLLRLASQHGNRTVREVAVEVAATGELPLPSELSTPRR